MPVDPKTPMIRKRTHGQFWPRLRILSPIAVISLVISMPMPATGAPGKIEERIFASGFENTAPYQPPIIVESSAYPDDWTDNFTTLQMGARYTLGSHNVKDVRLFLNGEEVTAAAQTTDRQVKYQPETPLSEGFHVAEVRISPVTHSWHFGLYDPERFVQSPEPGSVMPAGTRPPIRAEFSHLAHRIDVSGIRLFVSGPAPYGDDQVDGLRETYGLEVTADSVVTASSIEFIPEQPLADSPLYYVQLRAPDRYVPGALYEVNWKFAVGRAPEFLEFQPGPEELLPPGSVPTIRVRVDSGAHRLRSHDLRFEDYFNQVASDARLNPDGSYIITHTPAGELEPLKRYCYWLTVQNEVFLTGQLENICFRIDQEWGRELEILSPQQETAVDIKKVEVRVRATAVRGELKRVRINGKPASWVGDSSIRPPKYLYHVSHIELRLGENLIEVEAEFSGVPDDVVERRHIRVHYVPAPEVTIDSPSDWQSFGPIGAGGGMVPGGARDLTGSVQRPVRIEGRSSTRVERVELNQQAAELSADGQSFWFDAFFLHEGANHISAVATDAHGRSASDQITVYVDQTAPLLTVESPTPDTVTSLRRIDVRGLVNEAVQAPVETAAPQVRVRNSANGSEIEAVVAGLGYVAEDVPLEVGLNRLEVIAQDQHGNRRSRTVELVRTLAGSGRLVALGGHRQSGLVGSALPQPLLVQAFDAEGQPLAGVPVHLDIVRGSGSLQGEAVPVSAEGANPPRNLVRVTDAEGLAQAWLHLGVDARPGSDVVRAWSPGMAEEVMFSATAEAGSPHSVHVYGSSGTQYVATGSTPIEALMVQVQDAQRNPVPGTLVEFRIDAGEARFSERSAPAGMVSDEGRTLTVRADRNGIAVVRPQAGETAETVRVEAEALTEDGERVGPVGFHLVVLDRQDGATRLAGKVLDHSGTPLAGVRLSIGRTALSVLSDENGDFEFTGQVPVGKVDLFVDGRDLRVNRSGSPHEYPALHFETSVVQGQLNQLPHPIYLPPIDLARAQTVGGDEEVTLTLPGFEGFEMRVQPNSVTFPDGSRVGPLVIAPVHNDRLPMVPLAAAGRFETVGWTIQPTNTRFDPPIEVRIPNTSGLRPGQTLPIQQWDHDLALFVPMGNGTVSEDGTQIISDPGSGITKAGWGGGPPPPPDNDGRNRCSARADLQCNECQRIEQVGDACPRCVTDISRNGNPCEDNKCKACEGGGCVAKHSEAVPSGAGEVDFLSQRARANLGANRGLFMGFPTETPLAGAPAPKWDVEFEPYCHADDGWRFKVKKLSIRAVLVAAPEAGHYNTLTREFLDQIEEEETGVEEPPFVSVCQVANRIERSYVTNASTHFSSVSLRNKILDDMNTPDFPGFTPFTRGHPGFYHVDGTWAHEEEHYRRFRDYVSADFDEGHASLWDRFKSDVQELRVEVLRNDESPVDVLDRSQQELDGLVREFQDAVKERRIDFNGASDHGSPSQFFRCSMNQATIQSDLGMLNEARERLACAVRPSYNSACPGVANGE